MTRPSVWSPRSWRSSRSSLCSGATALSTQAEPEEERRPDDAPPVEERADLRIRAAPGIGLRYRHLAHAIPERDRLEVDVILELVAVEPWLVDADPGVIEQRETVGAKAVRHVRARKAGHQAEREAVPADREIARERQILAGPPGQVA